MSDNTKYLRIEFASKKIKDSKIQELIKAYGSDICIAAPKNVDLLCYLLSDRAETIEEIKADLKKPYATLVKDVDISDANPDWEYQVYGDSAMWEL